MPGLYCVRMEHRRLGASGLKVSEIALGSWATMGAQIDDDASHAIVQAALDCGITTFDTSDAYADGRAEILLGQALAGVRRESIELSTKVFWPTGAGANERGLSRKHIREACDASLRRLQTDYIDLYQAHRFDPETPIEETLSAFDDLVHQGKVLYVGVSEWSGAQIREAASLARQQRLSPLVSNQPQYSMLWRVIEEEVVPACIEWGLGQIVWSPLAQGVLSGKYHPGARPPEGSRVTDRDGSEYIARWMDDSVLSAVQSLVPVAADLGLTTSQLAIAWVLDNPSVSAAIIGASRPDQVVENTAACGVRLDEATRVTVDAVLADVIRWRRPA